MHLSRLSEADGSWAALKSQWARECEDYDEDFATYAQGSFSILDPLAGGSNQTAGVYALQDGASYLAMCQCNTTPLPGHPEPVLRVRMMVMAPKYDFGEFEISDYGKILVGLFAGVLNLSGGASGDPDAPKPEIRMKAQSLKFHLRSMADRQFFAALEVPLQKTQLFSSVRLKGMWLYVTKS